MFYSAHTLHLPTSSTPLLRRVSSTTVLCQGIASKYFQTYKICIEAKMRDCLALKPIRKYVLKSVQTLSDTLLKSSDTRSHPWHLLTPYWHQMISDTSWQPLTSPWHSLDNLLTPPDNPRHPLTPSWNPMTPADTCHPLTSLKLLDTPWHHWNPWQATPLYIIFHHYRFLSLSLSVSLFISSQKL